MTSDFRVLGAGVWGLAFSDYLLKLGHNVEIFCRMINCYFYYANGTERN